MKANRDVLGSRILVVEDNALVQKITVMAIEALGYQVDTAATGAEAIAQFKAHHYQFIFMDLGLPDIDGCTVTETIRELEDGYHTPIVALTAHTDEMVQENALKSGMDDFLSKPLTADHAKAVIEKYI